MELENFDPERPRDTQIDLSIFHIKNQFKVQPDPLPDQSGSFWVISIIRILEFRKYPIHSIKDIELKKKHSYISISNTNQEFNYE